MVTDRVLCWFAVAHLVLGVAALIALAIAAAPIGGVHPALKPMKFGLSIAVFLATLSILVPMLSIDPALRRAIAWTLSLTMAVESAAIVLQALRGTTSHYNIHGAFNTAVLQLMALAVLIAGITMIITAAAATARPLAGLDAFHATAWRAGLWMFLLALLSGFLMASRMRHSIGGPDGGPGLPVTNWSVTHGDLRVSHFLSLHALQSLPLIAAALAALPLAGTLRWLLLIAAIAAHVGAAVGTLLQAFAGRPLW